MTNGDLPGRSVDGKIHLCLEGRTLLHEMVTEQAEAAALGIYGRFVVQRTVFEAVHELGGYSITARDLGEVSIGEVVTV